MAFLERLESWKVAQGKIGIVWLGQAGFLFKLPDGRKLLLDAYLTDYTYKVIGQAGYLRMSAPLFEPQDIKVQYLFVSHEHEDHLDLDALPVLASGSRCFANSDCVAAAQNYGVSLDNLAVIQAGDVIELEGFCVTCLKADHGKLAPRALGFLFDFGYIRVYYSGDTCYNKEVLRPAIDSRPQVALLPINGACGNLNAIDAALLARDLGARVCVPHHFWTFPAHAAENGDPMTAIRYFPQIAPDCTLALNTPGTLMEF